MNLSGWYRLPGTRGLKSAGGGLKLIWPGPRLLILGIHIQRECGNLPAGLPALGLLAGSRYLRIHRLVKQARVIEAGVLHFVSLRDTICHDQDIPT
jgi:hypothetical protein